MVKSKLKIILQLYFFKLMAANVASAIIVFPNLRLNYAE